MTLSGRRSAVVSGEPGFSAGLTGEGRGSSAGGSLMRNAAIASRILAAMANRGDPQISLRSSAVRSGNSVCCDGIFAKCCLVLLKTQRSQPFRDVHRRSMPQSDLWQGVCAVGLDLSSRNLGIGAQWPPRSDREAFHRDGTSASLGWFYRSANEDFAMLRSILFAVLLAGLIAPAQPTAADPLAATASAHVQAAAAVMEQPVPLPAPGTSAEHRMAPAGFGWG